MSFDLAALPPLAPGAMPADLRSAPKATQDAYRAGLGFEKMLVQQLAKGLEKATQADGEEGGDGASSLHAQAIPSALADGVMAAGGLGLARTFVDDLGSRGR